MTMYFESACYTNNKDFKQPTPPPVLQIWKLFSCEDTKIGDLEWPWTAQ